MSTAEVALPAVSAPDAGGSSSPAPAVSTPSTPSTPVSSPAVTETHDDALPSGKSQLDYLKEELAKVPKEDAERAFRGEESPVKPEVKPEVKPAVETKPAVDETPEQKAERERLAAEQTPEQKAAAEKLKAIEKLAPLPAEQIAKMFQDDKELAAKVPQDVQDKMIANARLAAQTQQYRELYPTIDAAKYAHESAGHFYDIEEGFPAIQNLEDLSNFVQNTLLPLTIITDPVTGEPLKNPDGTFQTDGSWGRFQKLNTDFEHGWITNHAKQQADVSGANEDDKQYYSELQAALDFVDEFRNNGYKRPGAKPVGDLTPEQKQKLADIERRENALKTTEEQTRTQQEKTYEDKIFNDTIAGVKPLISATLAQTSLNDSLKKKAENDIYAGVLDRLQGMREYQQLKRQYWSRGMNDANAKALASLNVSTIEGIFASVAEKVIGEYGGEAIRQSADKLNKIDTQTARAHMDPTTTTSSAAPGPKLSTEEEIDKQAEANVLARHGGRRTPTFNQEWLTEVFHLKQAKSGTA